MSAINTTVSTLASAGALDRTQTLLSRSLSRLSSGSKIVEPSDDAAGLADADKLDAQSLRVTAASTNVQNAISYVQTGDGVLSGIGDILSRMSQLTTLTQDPTKNAADKSLYQQEFQSLQDQLRTTIGGTTAEIGGAADITQPAGSFNGQALFGSTADGGITLTTGGSADEAMTIPDVNLRAGAMLDLIQQDASGNYAVTATDSDALATVTNATQQASTARATFGAAESRLGLAATKLSVESQNLASTVSSIRDVDVAQESTQYAKYNILVQAGTAMLTQASQDPQSVLKLLQSK